MAWLRPLLCCLILAGSLCGKAQSPNDRFALPKGTLPLEEALQQLNQAGVELSYRPELLPQIAVRIPGGRRTTERWLELLLKDTELIFAKGAAGYLVLVDPELRDREFNLFGTVTDASSGERLIGATVQIPDHETGTNSNEYGFYTLTAAAGRRKVRVTYVGYSPVVLDVLLTSDTLIDLSLRTNRELPQIIVTAAGNDGEPAGYLETSTRIGRAEVAQLGGPGGEDDPLQLARLLPGVTSGADGIGGALIRGSEAGHNLILLDGVPVYGLSHAGGLFSIFSNQAIRRIDLYKDGLPARFGDRIGGVLDVHTRDGNLYENELTVGSSLLSAQVVAEGPIVEGESSFLLTGRYFWAGPLLAHYSSDYKERRGRKGRTDYNVYDFNFKLNQKAGERGRIYLSLYRGLDDYSNNSWQTKIITSDTTEVGPSFTYDTPVSRVEQARWGNTIAAVRYNHIFSDRLFGNFRAFYSELSTSSGFERYDSVKEVTQNISQGEIFSGRYLSDIQQYGLAFDGQYKLARSTVLRFGTQANLYRLSPWLRNGMESMASYELEYSSMARDTHRPVQGILYGSLSGQLGNLHYRVGLRASGWYNDGARFLSLSPRLLLAGPLNERADWQLTYDRAVQHMHLLNSFVIGFPSDLWVPSTRNIAPATAPQYAAKLRVRPAKDWNVESTIYYKELNGLVAYAEGAQTQPDWIDNLSRGQGRAFGWETMVQRSRGKVRGWLSYTLARSDRNFDSRINRGETFSFRYDRRHSLSLLLIYQIGKQTTLTGSWRYETGLAYSVSAAILPDLEGSGDGLPYAAERNGYRMPANHRLDLNLHTVLSGKNSKITHALDVGLYNVYNRHNPVYYDPRPEFEINADNQPDSRVQTYQIFVAPLLPSLSYHLTFSSGGRAAFGR